MTEPLGEATVLIRPDTTGFRKELQLSLASMRPVVVPVAFAGTGATAAASGLSAVKSQTKGASDSLKQMDQEIKKNVRSLGQLERGAGATGLSLLGVRGATLAASGAFLAGAAAVTLFAKAVTSTVSLTSQLKTFQATTGATADDLRRVSATAQALGRDLTLPGISAGDAAVAMTELAKAGLSVEDSIAGARGVLQLAIAAQISFADATTLAASALNAFGLQGDQAAHVADVLANAANSAQGSIQDMGLALQQSAAVGKMVGLSLEDTTTFLTILARAGLRGSDAGTSLRVALARLVNPTKAISKELNSLGVALRDANGNIRPDFFVNLGAALQGESKAQRDATLATIGGMDAMRALSILTGQSIQDLIRMRQALSEQGTAANLAGAQMTGLKGAAANFANTLQGIGITVGTAVTPALTSMTNALTGAVSAFATAFAKINSVFNVGLIVSAVAAWKLLPPILTAIASASGSVGLGLGLLVSAEITGKVAALRMALAGLLATLSPMNLLFPAIGIGIFGLMTRTSEMERATSALTSSVDALSAALSDLGRSSASAKEALSALPTASLALDSARIQAAQARAALANSQAPQGSIERTILENQLAIAIDNVRIAEERLAQAQKAAADAAAAQSQAEANHARVLEETAKTIAELNVVTMKRSLTGEQEARVLDKMARKEEELNTTQSRTLAQRLSALAALARAVGGLPDQKQIEIFLKDQNFKQGLRDLVVSMGLTGAEGADKFIANVVYGFAQEGRKVWKTAQDILDVLVNLFYQGGLDSAAAFNRGLTEGAPRVGGGVGVNAPQQAVQATLAQQIQQALIAGDLQTALALSRQQEAILKKQTATQKAKGNEKMYQKSLDAYERAHNQTVSIENQIASDQKQAADATQKKAKLAQDARDKADQHLQDLFGVAQGRHGIKEAVAQGTTGLKDDITEAARWIAVLKLWRAKFASQIHDSKLKTQLIQALTLAIIEERNAIRAWTKQIQDNAKEAKKARRQRIQNAKNAALEGLRLKVDIAAAEGHVKKQIAAYERLIRAEKRRLAAMKKDNNEKKRLQLQLAQDEQALKELKKQTDKNAGAAKELGFAFLQAQQGFAANLLSNILPGAAFAGTVGGKGTGTGAFATPLSPGLPVPTTGGREQTTRGLSAASALSQTAAARGASQSQMATLIALTRMMVRILSGQARGASHPEANYHVVSGRAAMDTYGV